MSRERGGRSFTTVSPIMISPSDIDSRPAIIRSSVDFPHPDGPTSTTNSPSRTSRSMPWITGARPKIFCTRRIAIPAIRSSLKTAFWPGGSLTTVTVIATFPIVKPLIA